MTEERETGERSLGEVLAPILGFFGRRRAPGAAVVASAAASAAEAGGAETAPPAPGSLEAAAHEYARWFGEPGTVPYFCARDEYLKSRQ